MGSRYQGALRADLARLAKKLDDMPDRSVIVDQHGDAWQKHAFLGYWYRAFDGDGVGTFHLVQHVHSADLVHKPSPEGSN